MSRFSASSVSVLALFLFLESFATSTFTIFNAEDDAGSNSTQPDWLLVPPASFPPVNLVSQCSDGSSGDTCQGATTTSIVLSNSLISRTFTVSPFFATTDFVNIQDPHSGSLLRGVSPAGTITLDGVEYDIGNNIVLV